MPGIACILTYEDVPQERFTFAGQTYPELSPYDRLILDRHIRFVGDAVAIVAGETEKAVDKAMKIIKVRYELLEPVLDFIRRKIIRCCCTRKKTGNPRCLWGRTIRGISVHLRWKRWEMWMLC